MSKLLIKGGRRLSGVVKPSGSKNAALPIIFATVLMNGTSVLYGVPDISDVHIAIRIIEDLGAVCTRVGNALYINTKSLEYRKPEESYVCRIRASSYLLGSCLSRFGIAHISAFGGCNFENRPIDMHIAAAQSVGAVCEGDVIRASSLVGADIVFDKISVGATVNALLLTVSARGCSRIYGYAHEPHIHSLISFLRTAGAVIRVTPSYIEVEGRALHGGTVSIIPDMIEAGTYLALSLATGSDIAVEGAFGEELSSFYDAVIEGGAVFSRTSGCVSVLGKLDTPCEIKTSPHPGFPTDLQPQMAPLFAVYKGGVIREGVWCSRFGYLNELSSFGVAYERTGSVAIIKPSIFHPAIASVPDLRGGAALIIAALIADGESIINDAHIIGRGYENIVNKLRSVGADINEIP